MAAAVEWALNDGRSRLTGVQMGLHTGDPRDFETFSEFKSAFERQLTYIIKHAAITTTVEEDVHWENMPRPFISAIVDGCVEKGLDISRGGARFNVGPGWVVVGTADVANSMAAVKKLVYEESRLSMDDLCQALDADFEGYDWVRQMLLKCPKYGNDDDYVDRFAVELTDFVDKELRKYRNRLGCPFHSAIMGSDQQYSHR